MTQYDASWLSCSVLPFALLDCFSIELPDFVSRLGALKSLLFNYEKASVELSLELLVTPRVLCLLILVSSDDLEYIFD